MLDCRPNLIWALKRISAAIASHHFYCSAGDYRFLLPPVNPASCCCLLTFIATASYFSLLGPLSASYYFSSLLVAPASYHLLLPLLPLFAESYYCLALLLTATAYYYYYDRSLLLLITDVCSLRFCRRLSSHCCFCRKTNRCSSLSSVSSACWPGRWL